MHLPFFIFHQRYIARVPASPKRGVNRRHVNRVIGCQWRQAGRQTNQLRHRPKRRRWVRHEVLVANQQGPILSDLGSDRLRAHVPAKPGQAPVHDPKRMRALAFLTAFSFFLSPCTTTEGHTARIADDLDAEQRYAGRSGQQRGITWVLRGIDDHTRAGCPCEFTVQACDLPGVIALRGSRVERRIAPQQASRMPPRTIPRHHFLLKSHHRRRIGHPGQHLRPDLTFNIGLPALTRAISSQHRPEVPKLPAVHHSLDRSENSSQDVRAASLSP